MRTISVKQLIEKLEQLPPDAPLAFASDYGDRCATQQIHFLRGRVEDTPICESGYSDSGYAVDRDNDGDGETSVYLIS
jgi:hypothetical protein